MAWLALIVAGILECGFAICLKLSDGYSKLLPTVGIVAFAAASLFLLSLALRTLPVGAAYAVWTGIGAAGTAIIGIVVFGESAGTLRLAAIGLILTGVVGLQLTGGGH